jgi:hypothetical protein
MTRENKETITQLRVRIRELTQWLQQECPHCFTEQKHLEQDSSERCYWHMGYMSALTDAVQLMQRSNPDSA